MIDALGSLGLWLNRRRAGHGDVAADIVAPLGNGPLVLVAAPDPDAHGPRTVISQLKGQHGGPRIAILGQAGLPAPMRDAAAGALIASLEPDLVLILGNELPVSLIEAAHAGHVPVILADAQISDAHFKGAFAGTVQNAVRRQLLRRMSLLLLSDANSRAQALRQGVPANRIRVLGPITETRDPLSCTEPERAALAKQLRGRHVWLATNLPESEEDAITAAHRAALRYSHRALLIVVPDRSERGRDLETRLKSNGFDVALRSDEIEPTEDIQVLVADETAEMGLWYRIAPVTFLGGTLSGKVHDPRHPFEPASLGSAIVHGPELGAFAEELQQLSRANATRSVSDAAGLADAVADLAQPDIVARLAANAWAVSTGGAGVAQDTVQTILTELDQQRRAR